MLLFALSVHSQPACCSSYVSLVFDHISVVYANVSNLKTPVTCVVISPLVSTRNVSPCIARETIYMTNRCRVVPCIS